MVMMVVLGAFSCVVALWDFWVVFVGLLVLEVLIIRKHRTESVWLHLRYDFVLCIGKLLTSIAITLAFCLGPWWHG